MKFRSAVSILVGLTAAVALGVLLNLVTSDAGTGVAAAASIVALLLSAFAAVLASRQAFLSKQALKRAERSRSRVGVFTVTRDGSRPTRMESTTIGGIQAETQDRWTRSETSHEDVELLLLGSFRALEAEATRVLNSELGERRRSIFDMRADLTRLGIWSDEDVRAFDRTVRVRNALVHGDFGVIDQSELVKAHRIVSQLTEKLEKI